MKKLLHNFASWLHRVTESEDISLVERENRIQTPLIWKENPDSTHFTILKASNGHIVTSRKYDAAKGAINNPYGPNFTDQIVVVPEGQSLIEAINRLLVMEKIAGIPR